MDKQFTLIPALTSQNAASSIMVRATRIWESINKETKQVFHTNVTLLDQEDNRIVAKVRNTQKTNYFPLIAEGKVYQISNSKVVNASKAYRVVNRNISLLIFHGTRIELIDDTGIIPKYKFELTTLEDVAPLINVTTSLIDVIVLVSDYGDLERVTNGAQKLDIILANERDKKTIVTLWEEKLHQFLHVLEAASDVPVFSVVCGLLAKKFMDNPNLSSTDATRCYLNIDYKPLADLRDVIEAATTKSATILASPVNRQSVMANAHKLKQLTIEQILGYHLPAGEKLARCLCLGEIVSILDDEGWYYNYCSKCAHKVWLLGQSNYCENCAENVSNVKQRYKLIVRVKDPSGTTTFTLFNKDVKHLIWVPMEKVFAELDQGNLVVGFPAVLNNMVGKTCMFDIKISPYNTNLGYEEYTVVKLSESAAYDVDPIPKGIERVPKRNRTS